MKLSNYTTDQWPILQKNCNCKISYEFTILFYDVIPFLLKGVLGFFPFVMNISHQRKIFICVQNIHTPRLKIKQHPIIKYTVILFRQLNVIMKYCIFLQVSNPDVLTKIL